MARPRPDCLTSPEPTSHVVVQGFSVYTVAVFLEILNFNSFTLDWNSRMNLRDGFADTVGNTPLIKLRKASEQTGCTILGKAEFLNPGGSVKDRAALHIVLDAEEAGELQPGGTVVEGTAGNTGIGLALVNMRVAIAP